MDNPRLIKAPSAGQKQELYIQPNEKVKFGFPLDAVKVDILGSDLVFTFKDGAQLVLTKLAVDLFS